MNSSLKDRMSHGGFDGYAYAYPHKTAYRPLDPPVPLADAWRGEDKRNLFLYVHLPFCEMRCGFCNLFTTVQPGTGLVDQTLDAIERQSAAVASMIDPVRVAQVAFGGGTPSFLTEAELERLFTRLGRDWPVAWGKVPVSFEVSPGTVTREKLALLKALGVDRISLGVQSFEPEDLVALKRPQPAGQLDRACVLIKEAGFPVFNLDLIYGSEGQTPERWRRSLERALEWQPEEIFIYPLYVGKLTNLDRSGKRPGEHRRALHRLARERLVEAGYRQVSMRHFRRADVVRRTDHCCQDDGMVGLGAGARSYTRALHYSSEYAVGQSGVKAIIGSFNARSAADFSAADYGALLAENEQRLRYVIKSILRSEGVSLQAYEARFGAALFAELPRLRELLDLELASVEDDTLRLNDEGLTWSDTIGPWLYSEATIRQMEAYEFA
jgi:oxygen-independent coproporphyrinogen III oxidase